MAVSMKYLLFTSVCLLAVSALLAKSLTFSEKKYILKKHNEIRLAVRGTKLPKLRWDEGLAEKAQRWADTCNYWHYGTEWGENIAYDDDDGPQTRKEAMASSLNMWMMEKIYDTHGDFSCCSYGRKDCCHYTQVLWKKTKRVGCGFSRCENMDHSIYTVCFYYPRGNIPGQRPY